MSSDGETEDERMWGLAIALAGSGEYATLSDLETKVMKTYPGFHFMKFENQSRLKYVNELIFKRTRKK